MATYTLELVNASSRRRTFCVLPEPSPAPAPRVARLAWLTAEVHPTTRLSIRWDDTVEAAWAAEPGESEFPVRRPLAPGDAVALVSDGDEVVLRESPDAVPGGMRVLVPDSVEGGAGSGVAGRLYVLVAGSPALAAPAEPGTALDLDLPRTVRVFAGSARAGETVMVEDVAQSALVGFPPGHTAMRATLRLDNTWEVGRARR